MFEVEVLKYGAMGIGLAVLGYTAALLRQELKRHTPRQEARSLILMFMLFSLAGFCIAIFLELREKSIANDVGLRNKTIAAIASSMDGNLGGKFEAFVRSFEDEGETSSPADCKTFRDSIHMDFRTLVFFYKRLCANVGDLKAAIGDSQQAECSQLQLSSGQIERNQVGGSGKSQPPN